MAKRVRRSSRKVSSSSSSSTSRSSDEELVKIEIDAAEALADFCNAWLPPESEMGGGGGGGGGRLRWQCKRRRSGLAPCGMRVASNSAVDFPLAVKDEYQRERLPLVSYNRFDTSEDSLEPAESPSSPLPQLGRYSKYVKSEAASDAKPSRWSGKYRKVEDGKGGRRVSACGKGRSSKTPVTEEEKEQRRLRRIEANRESARQTIRRKQKMCEEMTIKANELTSENERIRQEIEAVRAEAKRIYETSCSLRKQLEMATGNALPALTSSQGSGSDDYATRDQSASSSKSGDPLIQQVQVNRQDDNIDSVEFSTSLALEPQISSSSSGIAAAVLNSYNINMNSNNINNNNNNNTNRPLHQVQGVYHNPHFTFQAKMMGGNRAYFLPQQQQPIYSFYPGKTIAAENRRRRKELKQTRLYSRQVALNS